jgi:AcrR family transcriptional regulator
MTTVSRARVGRPKDPQRRQRILDAACRAFAADGYAGTSLADVARGLGLTKAALLHHFESKEALYVRVVSDLVRDLGEMLSRAATFEGSFDQRLDHLGAALVDFLGTRPGVARLALSELIGRGPWAQGPGRALVTATTRYVVDFLQSGVDEGAIAPQPLEHLAMSIIGLHLLWFASDLSGELIDDDPSAPARIEERKAAVLHSIRALCR